MFELTWHFSVGFDSLSTERNEMEFNYLICMGSLPKKTIGEFEQILTRMLRLQMTENSPEPRGIRKAKKATWKYSSESNSNISPLLLFHNSRAFCILKRSSSPLKRISQTTIKLIIIYIPGVSAVSRKITRWQNGFRLLYFKGMIYRQKTTEAIMKSKNNFWIYKKKKKNDLKTFYNNLWCFSHNCCTITGSLNYFFVFHCFLVRTSLVIK